MPYSSESVLKFYFNVYLKLTVCPGGQTRDDLSTGPCMDCGEGKYKNESGNRACDSCPDPFHTTLTNRSTNDSACSKLDIRCFGVKDMNILNYST